jgi:hypothetical protein
VKVTRINDTNRDSAEGFRFYLPRPYVVVKEPFFVAGSEVIVAGVVRDGQIVEIDARGLDPAFQQMFPSNKGTIFISGRNIRSALPTKPPAAPPRAVQQAGEEKKAKPLDDGSLLEGSKVDPNLLDRDKTEFQTSVILSEKAPFVAIAHVKIALAPLDDDGKPKLDELVELPETKVTAAWKAKTKKGVYTANGRRSDLKNSDYTLVLLFDATKDEESTLHVVHGSTLHLHAVGVKTEEKPAEKKEEKKEEEKKEKEEEKAKDSKVKTSTVSASASTSGDPTTNPLISVSSSFDVLMLPDFDEQYAIDHESGIGIASLELGMENGWMVEKASVEIDNSRLGQFIVATSEKLVDFGLEVARAATSLKLPSLFAKDDAEQQSGDLVEGSAVLLKIRYAVEAQRGLYPVLKRSETSTKAPVSSFKNGTVYVPYPPLTVVAYDTRRYVDVELLAAREPRSSAGPELLKEPKELEVVDRDKVEAWLKTQKGGAGELTADLEKVIAKLSSSTVTMSTDKQIAITVPQETKINSAKLRSYLKERGKSNPFPLSAKGITIIVPGENDDF